MATNKKYLTGNTVRNSELFKALMRNLVEDIASSVSQEEFQSVCKTLDGRPAVAQRLYDMQKSAITNDLHQDIDYLFDENDIDKKYNGITKLMQQYPADKIAWRPKTGDGKSQMYAYEMKYLQEKKKKLEIMIQKERTLRMLAKDELDRKRDVIENHLSSIATANIDLDKYLKSLDQDH